MNRLPKHILAGLMDQIRAAQSGITGGKQRHEFVAKWLKAALKAHDMPGVPNWLENIAEPLLVDLVVQFAVAAWKEGRAGRVG